MQIHKLLCAAHALIDAKEIYFFINLYSAELTGCCSFLSLYKQLILLNKNLKTYLSQAIAVFSDIKLCCDKMFHSDGQNLCLLKTAGTFNKLLLQIKKRKHTWKNIRGWEQSPGAQQWRVDTSKLGTVPATPLFNDMCEANAKSVSTNATSVHIYIQ